MLQSKKYEVGTIVSFKLPNGEELIADVQGHTDNGYMLKDPLTLAMGQQGLQMIPSLFGAVEGKQIELKDVNILMSSPSRDEVKQAYLQQVTGLQIVEKSSEIVT